jgi:heptosyltransferase I
MESQSPTIHVLLVRLTALGDVVQAADAFREIRSAFPQVIWHWAVADIYVPLLEGEEGLASILPVPRRWSIKSWWAFKKAHSQRHFDLIIDTQTLLKSWLVGAALSKHRVVTWGPRQSRDWLAPRLAHAVVNEAPVHSRSATLSLIKEALKIIGITCPTLALEAKPKSPWTQPKLRPNPRIICSVGAGWPTKQLSLEAWSNLLACIRKDYPKQPLLFLIGTEAEAQFLNEAKPHWACYHTEIIPKMSLRELKLWLSAGDLFIGMDSGPSHLAASCGLVTLTWYGPSLPEAYDRYGVGPQAPRGTCHLQETFIRRCDRLRKCASCSALQSIDIEKAWHDFRLSLKS